MARSNIGIDELQKMLEKSGLPMGDSFAMRQAQPIAGQALRGTGGDHGASGAMQAYRAKLDQIAQMDQKLSGVYGDPTSPLYIEHAGARDSAASSSRGTGMAELSSIEQRRQQALAQQEADIAEAESTYAQLENAQKELEAEQKKIEKEQAKAAKKAGTSGKKSSTSGGSSGKIRLTSARIEEIDALGIDHNDKEAIEMLYIGMPTASRKKLIQRVQQGKQLITKGDYWDADRLKYETSAYDLGVAQGKAEQKNAPKKSSSKKSATGGSLEDKLKLYSELKAKK